MPCCCCVHALSDPGELIGEEVADGPRGLRVQSAGRLIQEEKQLRLGGELDADRESLALLDVETFARHTDDSTRFVCFCLPTAFFNSSSFNKPCNSFFAIGYKIKKSLIYKYKRYIINDVIIHINKIKTKIN